MRKLTEEETLKVIESARRSNAADTLIEIDLNAKLSMGSNAHGNFDGCYVQAWVWVDFKDAGVVGDHNEADKIRKITAAIREKE